MSTSSKASDGGRKDTRARRFDAWAIATVLVFVLLVVARVLVQV